MAQNGDLPEYFARITFLRASLFGLFTATAIITGRSAKLLPTAARQGLLDDLNISAYGYPILHAALILTCVFSAFAATWAVFNLLGRPSRRAALRISFVLDSLVASVSVISIALAKVALEHVRCDANDPAFGSIRAATTDERDSLGDWCSRFDLGFRLTVTILVLHVVSCIVMVRFYIHERLARFDDWPNDRPTKAQSCMRLFQIFVAPIRFLWRCLRKFTHASENPLQWGLLLLVLVVPLVIILLYRALIGISKSALLLIRDTMTIFKTLRTVKNQIIDTSTELFECPITDVDNRARFTKQPEDTVSAPIAMTFIRKENPSRQIKLSAKSVIVGSTSLERLLLHTDLFFVLLSHLHGIDVRALGGVSSLTHKIMEEYWATYPRTIKQFLSCRVLPGSASECFVPAINSASLRAHPSALPPRGLRLEYAKQECWSCGITICAECHLTKHDLRISKAEIRLRSLEPVCSTCYFKCLCHSEGVFSSLSAQCSCTTRTPPRADRDVCKDCFKLDYQKMWKKRLRRGARMHKADLPQGWDQWLDDYPNNIAITTSSDSETRMEAGLRSRETSNPAPFHRIATNIKNCSSCNGTLWWWFGQSRGLRWWRCQNCGLEARNCLMSVAREFA